MLYALAHQWYITFVANRVDTNYAGLSPLDEFTSVAVPCVLIGLAMIARDPRLSIAAAVTTGASLIATLYATIAFEVEWHAFLWISLSQYLIQYVVQPSVIIVVSAITTAATMRGDQRAVPR
jgi:hypothetical protein